MAKEVSISGLAAGASIVAEAPSASWIRVSGTGQKRSVEVEANTGASQRSGFITVTASDGATASLAVTQAAETYTITFDLQGGAGIIAPKSVVYGHPVGNLHSPTRDHLLFSGWYTGKNGSGTRYYIYTVYSTKGDITLYANWEAPPPPPTTTPTAGGTPTPIPTPSPSPSPTPTRK